MLILKSAKFVLSVADAGNCLSSDLTQVAVCGKSNVGKSSFINFLTGQNKLAKTSKSPGRTRLINYFLLNEGQEGEFLLVDLPGYGFAKVSFFEKQRWGQLIDAYLLGENRPQHILFLVDIRHEPTFDDKLMYNFLFANSLPFTVIATKADKIAKSKVNNRLCEIAKVLKIGQDNIIAVSSEQKTGRDKVLKRLHEILI